MEQAAQIHFLFCWSNEQGGEAGKLEKDTASGNAMLARSILLLRVADSPPAAPLSPAIPQTQPWSIRYWH